MTASQPPAPVVTSSEVSWKCSASRNVPGLVASMVRRTRRATSWLWSSPSLRPVMLATSMRQPSRPSGPSSQRATTLSGAVDDAAPQVGGAVVELGQAGDAEPGLVAVGVLGEVVVARPRASAGSACAARNQSCPAPVWLVVRSPDHPDARPGAPRRPARPAPRRRRAAGRPRRSSRRRSGGCSGPGTPASGTARPRPRSTRCCSRCSMPSRSPPYSCRGVDGPSWTTGSSQPAGSAQAGSGPWSAPERANRSGKTW